MHAGRDRLGGVIWPEGGRVAAQGTQWLDQKQVITSLDLANREDICVQQGRACTGD